MSIITTRCSLFTDLKRDDKSQAAWREFVERYQGAIFGWCLRRGFDHHTAEDLTQEILIKLMQALPEYNYDPSRGRFRAWLKTMATNLLADAWRRDERRAEPRGHGGETSPMPQRDAGNAIEELSALIERRAESLESIAMQRVRERVEGTSWQAFHRCHTAGLPAKDVARELGLSTAAVYKHKFRIRRMVLDEYRQLASDQASAT